MQTIEKRVANTTDFSVNVDAVRRRVYNSIEKSIAKATKFSVEEVAYGKKSILRQANQKKK